MNKNISELSRNGNDIVNISISFHKKNLVYGLATKMWLSRVLSQNSDIYIHNLSIYYHCSEWTRAVHVCNCPSTCKRVLYVWTGPPTDIGFSICERDHSLSQCHKTWNSHKHFNIPCHTSPGLIIYHAMSARPYTIPCHTSLSHIICHVMPDRRYHLPCHIAPGHTTPCPAGHIIYHAIPCQALPYTMPCPQGHTIYRAIPRQTIQYTISCLKGHTIIQCYTPPDNNIYHAIPCQANTYTMRCPPAIPYTIVFSSSSVLFTSE